MSQWDKLLLRVCSLSKDLRFNELRKVLERYGYKMDAPGRLRYPNMNRLRKYILRW